MSDDLVTYNRAGVANAYRRLERAAAAAADAYARGDVLPHELDDAAATVAGRVSGVSHARDLHSAALAGAARSAYRARSA